MYNIQTLNKISAIGTDIFDKSKYSVSDNCEKPDAIMVRSAKMHDMEFGENLLAIARAENFENAAELTGRVGDSDSDYLIYSDRVSCVFKRIYSFFGVVYDDP